jgi:hypothetical protein
LGCDIPAEVFSAGAVVLSGIWNLYHEFAMPALCEIARKQLYLQFLHCISAHVRGNLFDPLQLAENKYQMTRTWRVFWHVHCNSKGAASGEQVEEPMRRSTAHKMAVTSVESGEPVPTSGIYRVPHLNEHSHLHDVIMKRADKAPECPVCGAVMTFELVRSVPQIYEDPDFCDAD